MPQTSNAGSPSRPHRFLSRSRFRLALALGAIVATAYTFGPRLNPFPFNFEITIRSSLPGFAQLYYDTGSGVNEKNSFRLPVEGGNRAGTYKFRLPEGAFWNFRFDPTDRARNSMALVGARIVDRAGTLVRAIPPTQFKVGQQIEGLEAGETEVTFTTPAAADDPILKVELGEPVILKSYARPSLRKLLRRFLSAFVICAALGLLAGPALVSRVNPVASRLARKTAAWAGAHPVQLLLAAATASVVLSCYPVVFFGRSFLSPNNHSHTYLLYGEMPTVPGSKAIVTDDEKGSDLGAAMWYSWPTSVVESRALFKHYELPLWNRYDASGLPLLGQGQSMFGDPLHFLVLLTNGSSGWWDLKYLLAKFLFATSLAFCVLQLTKHQPAAIVIALSSPFIGFFAFRYSHPAFFSMCYAPFILLCWFKFIDTPKSRLSALWLGMMVLANWMVINSGTVKEAYTLLLGMNLCGFLTLLLARTTEKIAKLGQAFVAQLLFLLIATPVWLTFLMTLRSSWTIYDTGGAFQLQPSLFVGLFDDIFYRQFNTDEQHFNPSANFLVLAGVLWFCSSGAKTDANRISWGLGVTCLLALAVAFGVVPPSLITRLPFLGNIYHIDNTFSCVAIVCLVVMAGFGIKSFWYDCVSGNFLRSYLRVAACFGALLALYLGTTEAAQRSSKAFLQIGEHISKSSFFWGYSVLLIVALLALPWIGRLVLKRNRPRIWQAMALCSIFLLLHWRYGMHLETPFDAYVMNPQPGANLIADTSPAIGLIHNAATEPARSAGLDYSLAPGYGRAVGVEQIDSVDPLLNKFYKTLMDAYAVRLLSSSSNGGFIEDQLESDLPLFDMLNVRYFLGLPGSKADVIPSLKKIASLDLNVYESSKVWPRAFFADRLIPYGSETDFVKLLREGDGRPFAAVPQADLDQRTELAALSHNSTEIAARQIVPASDYALTNNKTSFNIVAPATGVVVLTEPFVEGDFQLRVNGRPASYFRVNSAFRGVLVPAAGEYHFSFAYWPRHLTISLWIFGFGILLLLLWLGSVYKYSRREA